MKQYRIEGWDRLLHAVSGIVLALVTGALLSMGTRFARMSGAGENLQQTMYWILVLVVASPVLLGILVMAWVSLFPSARDAGGVQKEGSHGVVRWRPSRAAAISFRLIELGLLTMAVFAFTAGTLTLWARDLAPRVDALIGIATVVFPALCGVGIVAFMRLGSVSLELRGGELTSRGVVRSITVCTDEIRRIEARCQGPMRRLLAVTTAGSASTLAVPAARSVTTRTDLVTLSDDLNRELSQAVGLPRSP